MEQDRTELGLEGRALRQLGRVTERPGLRALGVRRRAWGEGVGDPEAGSGAAGGELAFSLQ